MNGHWKTLVAAVFLLAPVTCERQAASAEPYIVGHRGLMVFAPEDTLSNFRACLELRLGFEFDVQRTKDRQLVCIHDRTLDRTTNGKGNVSDVTLAELKQLDAGAWFDARFGGERVPTVAEVISLLADRPRADVLVAVDFKADEVALEVVRMAEKYRVVDRLLFIGTTISDPAVRRTIRQASAGAGIAVVANSPEELSEAAADPDANWVYLRYLPTKAEVDAAGRRGKRVFIAGATVAGQLPRNWQTAAEAGVDGILTDHPLDLRTVLRQIVPQS